MKKIIKNVCVVQGPQGLPEFLGFKGQPEIQLLGPVVCPGSLGGTGEMARTGVMVYQGIKGPLGTQLLVQWVLKDCKAKKEIRAIASLAHAIAMKQNLHNYIPS
jgi:hypothetical protein